MREANSVLRQLEELFQENPDIDTASLVIAWADELRDDLEKRTRTAREAAQFSNSLRYYGLIETVWRREANHSITRFTVATHRIKPEDFPAFCKSRGLNEKKLKAVAVGDEASYEGYQQASWNGYMIGHEYRPLNEDDALPPVPKRPRRIPLFPEPKPEGRQYGTSQEARS